MCNLLVTCKTMSNFCFKVLRANQHSLPKRSSLLIRQNISLILLCFGLQLQYYSILRQMHISQWGSHSVENLSIHTDTQCGSPLWLIPDSRAYESMENSDHIPTLSLLVIFTHCHFTLFKPYFHLFCMTLFSLAVRVFSCLLSAPYFQCVCSSFPGDVGLRSWVTVQLWWSDLTQSHSL